MQRASRQMLFLGVVVSWRQYDSGVIAELLEDPVASANNVVGVMGCDGK